MVSDGYLQTKIREQNEKIIGLEQQIKKTDIRLEQLESLPFSELQNTLEKNNSLLRKTNSKEDLDKKIDNILHNLTFKIQKINRHFYSQFKNVYNTVNKAADEKINYNIASLCFIFTILNEVGITHLSEQELNDNVTQIKNELDKEKKFLKTTIKMRDYENKMLFDVLKEK